MPAPKKPVTSRVRKAAPKKVDPKDEADVQAAIERLTKRLRAERQENAVFRRAIQKNKSQIQKLEAWRRSRKGQLSKIRQPAARRVLEAALKCVGQTESPAGSNRGPGIVSKCQVEIIGYSGVAWCGCFTGYFLRKYAGLPITSRNAYCPYTVADAKAGTNGYKTQVPLDKGAAGDVVTFDWQHDGVADHQGFILENLGNGWYKTLEGNTSFDDAGSQSNGGCVAIRKRYSADFAAICRPAY